MEGTGRRTAAACPRPAARDSLYTPVRVVEPDPDEPGAWYAPGGRGAADPPGRVLALVRLHGHLPGLVTATGTAGGGAALHRALVDVSPPREPRVPTPSTLFTPFTPSTQSTATPAARPGRAGRARVPAGPRTCAADRTGGTPVGRAPSRGAARLAAPPWADTRSAARSGLPRPGCPPTRRTRCPGRAGTPARCGPD
ncbi:hypothetical protein [Kitasatospora sp. NPDC093558]|uniref:hypothetical protein n=1 Tax=Kitasatospora sp. NPDC093558 TaxID=3155201 RepID=UPI003415B184